MRRGKRLLWLGVALGVLYLALSIPVAETARTSGAGRKAFTQG